MQPNISVISQSDEEPSRRSSLRLQYRAVRAKVISACCSPDSVGLCETDLDVDDISDSSFFDQRFYFLEIGKVTPIIGNEARNSRLVRNAVDAAALLVSDSHRLFNVNRLSAFIDMTAYVACEEGGVAM